MTYSYKRHPGNELDFPPPPEWLTWIEHPYYDRAKGQWVYSGEGQIRHFESLSKAKQYIGRWAWRGHWEAVWMVCRWDFKLQKYVREFEGKKGDIKKDHPLWKIRVSRKTVPREVPQDELDAAMESIRRAQMNVAKGVA